MKTVDPSRRAILAAGSAAAILGALTTPARANHHDAEFRRLAAKHDEAIGALHRVRAELEPIEAEFHSKVRDGAGRRAVPWERFLELHKAMGVEEAERREDEALSKIDDINKQIRALPTLSVYAIAVKLKILHFDLCMKELETDDLEEMDWDQQCYVRLLREVEALAADAGYSRAVRRG